AGDDVHEFHALAELVDEVGAEVGEDRDGAQVAVEGAGAVVLIELFFEGRRVVEDVVEDVGQHLEGHDVGGGASGGGPGVKLGAFEAFLFEGGEGGEFADEVAGFDLRDRVVEGEIDGGVDGDVGAGRGFVVFGRRHAGYVIGDLGEALEESFGFS